MIVAHSRRGPRLTLLLILLIIVFLDDVDVDRLCCCLFFFAVFDGPCINRFLLLIKPRIGGSILSSTGTGCWLVHSVVELSRCLVLLASVIRTANVLRSCGLLSGGGSVIGSTRRLSEGCSGRRCWGLSGCCKIGSVWRNAVLIGEISL